MSNAQDLGAASSLGGNFLYEGPANNIEQTNLPTAIQGSAFQNYGGIANNFSSADAIGISGSVFLGYTGYAASMQGALASPLPPTPELIDNQPVAPWPKDQHIYYKLVGYNTNTSTFETWIIVENIVDRTETFEPSGSFPNIDYNVFFSPPSGNALSNIRIVGRWIQ
jgi:hypothetical protein